MHSRFLWSFQKKRPRPKPGPASEFWTFHCYRLYGYYRNSSHYFCNPPLGRNRHNMVGGCHKFWRCNTLVCLGCSGNEYSPNPFVYNRMENDRGALRDGVRCLDSTDGLRGWRRCKIARTCVNIQAFHWCGNIYWNPSGSLVALRFAGWSRTAGPGRCVVKDWTRRNCFHVLTEQLRRVLNYETVHLHELTASFKAERIIGDWNTP